MYVLAKKFGNDKISGKDGFSEVPKIYPLGFFSLNGCNYKFVAFLKKANLITRLPFRK